MVRESGFDGRVCDLDPRLGSRLGGFLSRPPANLGLNLRAQGRVFPKEIADRFATLLEVGDWGIRRLPSYDDADLVQSWRTFLHDPDLYLRHLVD